MMRFLVLAALVAAASASCPNDCSGHGACNQYSACDCMRNWMGADCSERVCQFARSYVDTPQGDLNSDGFVDRGNVKTVILGATSSFWNEDDGTVCDGTGCECVGPCSKYTTATTFTTFYGGTIVGTFLGASSGHGSLAWVSDGSAYGSTNMASKAGAPTQNPLTPNVAPTANPQSATGNAYIVTSCNGVPGGFARKATSITTETLTTIAAPTACEGSDTYDTAFNGRKGTILGATAHTLASPIYPADEYTYPNNDPFNFIANCNAKYGISATELDGTTNTATWIDHAIKVEVDDAFADLPSADGSEMGDDYVSSPGSNPHLASVPFFTPTAVDRVGGTGKANPLTSPSGDATETGIVMTVCAVSSTVYSTQWSPRKQWELYPDQHGWGTTAGGTTTPSAADLAKYDEAHFFKECAGKGRCDRSSGECECYPGFEGTGCIRTACPEGCSGHGFCKRIADVTDTYLGWDNFNSQHCVCEPGYEGADCSLRTCPKGHDPIHRGLADEVQIITFTNNGRIAGPGDFGADAAMALIFTDEFGDEWATESFVVKPKGTRVKVCSTVGETAATAPVLANSDGAGGASKYDADLAAGGGVHDGSNTVECALGAPTMVDGIPSFTIADGGSGYDPSNPPTAKCAVEVAGTCAPTVIVSPAGTITGFDWTGITFENSPAFGSGWLEVFDPPHPGTFFSWQQGAANMARALENLPNNVVPAVTITIDDGTPPTSSGDLLPRDDKSVRFLVTFTDNSGDVADLGVRFGNPYVRGSVAEADVQGNDDADHGIAALAGVAQSWIVSAAAHADTGSTFLPRWSCAGVGADGTSKPSVVSAATNPPTYTADAGCAAGVYNKPQLGWVVGVVTLETNGACADATCDSVRGTKYNDVCSRRGICDYSSGTCKCFSGFTDVDCHVQNALAIG